ncbi:ketopantoate reductase family protein [Kitasatospora sp. LaBMicrA B282]|uniref:ketopantoate reductase family protein n=1 Tax=Kitasatospora sp. LaBMicrA B282 TaxID=3420949 RepID=UPI003D0CB4BB
MDRRYVVIGAGAIGGVVGARLHRAGHRVVLVARGDQRAALRQHGLTVHGPAASETVRIPVVAGPEELELRDGDVLLLAVKTQDSAAALAAWAGRPVAAGGRAADRLPLVCLQNGVENERLALRHFRQVYGAMVVLPAEFLTPGQVRTWCGPRTGALVLGRYPGGADRTARDIAADLNGSDFRVLVDEDVLRWKYGKLVGNLANAVDALCGRRPGAEAADLAARAKAEAVAVLDRSGIGYAAAAELAELRRGVVEEPPAAAGPGSTWQSLKRGGSAEVDYLNGEIVLLGRACGVPTPVNEALQALVNRWARERREPGSLAPAELARLIESELIEPELIEPELIGSELIGSELIGSELLGSEAIRSEPAGTEQTGSAAAPAEQVGAR